MSLSKSGVALAVFRSTDDDCRLRIRAADNKFSQLEFADDDADAGEIRYDHVNDAMSFHVNANTERFRIDSSGRLLTGGATVSQGSTNADDLQIGANNQGNQTGITLGSASASSIRFADAGADSQGVIAYAHGDDSMRFSTGGTTRFLIDSNGNATLTGTTGNSSPRLNIKHSNADVVG